MVEAATTIADAEGLEALTMRRVAKDLGVVPMTLYSYVPGKAELLDLMLDAAPRSDLPLGPGQMAKYEHEPSGLDGLGLDDVETDDCLTHLLTFVQACARAAAARAARNGSATANRRTGNRSRWRRSRRAGPT